MAPATTAELYGDPVIAEGEGSAVEVVKDEKEKGKDIEKKVEEGESSKTAETEATATTPSAEKKTEGEASKTADSDKTDEDASLDGYVTVTPNVEAASDTNGTTPATSKELVKVANPGMKCEAIDFYLDKEGAWTKTYPTNIEEAAENDETALFAILKRNSKSTDARKKFSLHSIIVQSPLIKKVLGRVFRGYDGVTTDLDRLEFENPFEAFVHRWDKFMEARKEEGDLDTRVHLDLLYDILYAELGTTLAARDDLLKHGVITFQYLWTMFEPATLIYKRKGESDRVMRVTTYGHDCDGDFYTRNHFVEWTGTKFGMEDEIVTIKKFSGTKRIFELSSFPLKYHPDTLNLQKKCIARGKKWEAHCSYLFKAYQGVGKSVLGIKYSVDSRVILDTAAFGEANPNYAITVYDLDEDDSYTPPPGSEAGDSLISLTPYQYLLATDILRGYSMKDKLWLTLNLSDVKEITWNDKAFSSLQLPDDTKDLVLAFAQSQIKREQVFDDIIEGKGKGIIMLLSGPPGVGKTLTAEACSESMKVPLYMMSAGDLGTEPWQVEESLKQILKMTTKWKAILLLDEADVFLEARSTHDLERNKLVSIFLRILEYYEGFLFLTSNRVDNIDAAFESRIHLSLQYGNLSVASRRQVWKTFLGTPQSQGGRKGNGFTEGDVDELAEIELNGRQIKNIIKTAQLLASSKGVQLGVEHVRVITRLRARHAVVPLRSGDAV